MPAAGPQTSMVDPFGFVFIRHARRTRHSTARLLDLHRDPVSTPLQDKFAKGFEYSDCWIEDSWLVLLNARDAEQRGAAMRSRCRYQAERVGELWHISFKDSQSGTSETVQARMLVNAGGPWVENIIHQTAGINSSEGVRLVRGSHIVTRKLFEHDKSYFFQGSDGRIIRHSMSRIYPDRHHGSRSQ